MRPAPRRLARAASAGIVAAALVTALLPALPTLATGPIKVTGKDISTTVDHERIVPLPDGASHVALSWSGGIGGHGGHAGEATAGDEPQVTIAFGDAPNGLGEEVAVLAVHEDESPDAEDLTERARSRAAGRIASGVIWTGGARFARITTDRPLGQVTVTTIDA
jgi:hypothetical protein